MAASFAAKCFTREALTRRGASHRQGRIPSRGKGKLRPVSRGRGPIHRGELSLPPHLHGIQASRRKLLLVQRPCIRRALARRAHVPNHRDNSYRGRHIALDVRLAKGDFVDLRLPDRVGGIDREIRLKNQTIRLESCITPTKDCENGISFSRVLASPSPVSLASRRRHSPGSASSPIHSDRSAHPASW